MRINLDSLNSTGKIFGRKDSQILVKILPLELLENDWTFQFYTLKLEPVCEALFWNSRFELI